VNQVEDVPQVRAVDDFEICRRDKTGKYEMLDEGKELKESRVSNWEVLYIQFKDESGELLISIIPLLRLYEVYSNITSIVIFVVT
jgi:hypothetical protein